ncbi:MAG: DNA-binding protein WhiA [Clostridiales bacterium]|nr:DNA-binding protein WhiA [Clostridiales bacterium]
MSFSSDVKDELSRIDNTKKCCMLAETAGFLRTAGSLSLPGGGRFGIVATTEKASTARHFKKLIQSYFKNTVTMAVGDSQMPGRSGRRGRNRYYLNISPEQKSMHILRETGMLLIREGDDYLSDGIYQPITRLKCCRKAYLRGLFLACGTVSDPRRSYHLEFVLNKEQTANDVKKLIGSFVDLSANISRRGDNYIVYVKKAAYISDILGIMGADDAVLEFQNIHINRGLHGDAQRLMNCDSANVDRMINAAEEQRQWINRIVEADLGRAAEPDDPEYMDGLKGLPSQLREVAVIRLTRPSASLAEIGEALTPPIGKAAVSKRFAKIKAMAEKIGNEAKE